ncbi:multidrug ABC transporter [Streptomyces noursei ZPM]|uniref:MFS transporter n=1 Tax=Streptomyces noursei TaxID=1971 RepID=B5BRA0_STRNR|nr:MFS transporter [Streptomyces noursei]AKA07292.1 multidrug ABC transporter [Streptomyces noursei ZPM]EPY92340.1 multidrug ABC transporter [Streptomyces noursei CCRC 11814]EXU90611.1 multidrug ABC transporter [Streptomyces noursei PD-1]UWS75847.1 MFS transporter [Streptomyces noursei]BAG68869.1 multidrug transporter [Streptomyces noursei]
MNVSTAPRSTEVSGRGSGVRIGVLVTALLVACFAFQLNASMLSPALKSIEDSLGASSAEVGMTQTAFFTSAALFSLFLPRLGDVLGRRRVLAGMLVLMAVGCVVAALSTSIPMLFAGRIIQGVSGPVVPLCLIMLRVEVKEPKKYGTLLGVITAVNGGIAGVDSLAGGYLADHHGFQSVFWAMAGVAALATVLVATLTPESKAAAASRMDWPGVALLVVSVGALLIALNEAGKLAAANWAMIAVLVVVAAAAFALFWRTENRSGQPLVATHHLRQRATWSLLLTTVLTMTGVFAVMNGLIPAFAQDAQAGLGMTAEQSAWWTLSPYALAGLAMGPLAGRLAATFGYGRILRLGLVGAVGSVVLMLLTMHSQSHVLLLVTSLLVGVTYAGVANIVLNGLGIVLSPSENPGFLPGLNAGAFNLGAGLSFAALYAVKTALTPSDPTAAGGYTAGMIAGVVILALAIASSFLIPKPTAAEATD